MSQDFKIYQGDIGTSDFGGLFGRLERAVCLRTATVAAAQLLSVSELQRTAVTAQCIHIYPVSFDLEQNLAILKSKLLCVSFHPQRDKRKQIPNFLDTKFNPTTTHFVHEPF